MLLRESSINKIYCSQKLIAAPQPVLSSSKEVLKRLNLLALMPSTRPELVAGPGATFFEGTIFAIKLVASPVAKAMGDKYAPTHTANTIQIS